VLLTALVAVGAWWFKHRAMSGGAARNTIAVLPLQNMNRDISVEFLQFALADEIANTLTYTRSLDVRPSAITRKFTGSDVDPENAGRELHVASVITGHFVKQGDHLLITLEAIQVDSDRLLWQTNVTAPADDLIAMQSEIAAQIRQGLLPARPDGSMLVPLLRDPGDLLVVTGLGSTTYDAGAAAPIGRPGRAGVGPQ
jgi:TolB-like protein